MTEREKEASPEPDGTLTAAATLPALDQQGVAALRAVGREWQDGAPDLRAWERALPVDPRLTYEADDTRGGSRFVAITGQGAPGAGSVEAHAAVPEHSSIAVRLGDRARRLLVGPALRSTAVAEERMRKLVALSVLSSDALSSVAYGPEAMLAVLVVAGSAQLKLSLPIAAGIVLLMVSVGLGYRQVIRAYPHGGGSYVVAAENIGSFAGLMAGAGLILDYTLTVAVSVASGVAAVTSALPSLSAATVPIGLAVIVLLVLGNLRGVRAAGAVFAGPTYLFVIAIAMIVVVGLVKAGGHSFHAVAPATVRATQGVGVLLVLRAFSSGATAMTGIEAISNSVPAFQPPEAENARRTLSVMIVLLILLFAGTVVLAHLDGAAPSSTETVLSQLAHRSVGGGVLYAFVQIATALVLLLAANAAFNGFPRLLFYMARDRYVPRAFLRMGDRLAFTHGIVVLAVIAAALFAGFGGKTDALIPLYAVGVFLAFTLSQSGMVVHWWRHRDGHWRRAAAVNGLGAVLCAAVLLITAVTKFGAGAWVVVILIPLIVLGCRSIHGHYETARRALTARPEDSHGALHRRPVAPLIHTHHGDERPESQTDPHDVCHLIVVPLAGLDLSALRALAYAASLRQPVLAVHVSPEPDEAERFQGYWTAWGAHLPLEVVVAPYRATVAPLTNYIEALHAQRPDLTLTVVVPDVVPVRFWQRPLHSRTGVRLQRALRAYPGIVVTSVPFHLPAA